MALNLANADAALKEFYLPTIREQLNQAHAMLQAVRRNTEDFEGRRAILSLHVNRNSGVGARGESETNPEAGSQGYAEERISALKQVATIRLTQETISAMKSDEGSYTRAVNSEVKGALADLKRDVNRQIFGTSDGVIGAAVSASANVITVSMTTTQLRQLHIGMKIDVGTVANPTLRGQNLRISAITRSTPSITVVGTLDNAGTTTTDRIFRTGSGGASGGVGQKEITGLQTIVAASGTLFNIDPTSVPEWVSYSDDNSSVNRAATDSVFETAIDEIELEGGVTPDVAVVSYGVDRNHAAQLKSQKRFSNTRTLAGGYEVQTVATSRGEIGFMAERDCPENTAFVLNTDHLIEFVLEDWSWMDLDGAVLDRVSQTTDYAATLFKLHELATDKRNAHGVISDLTEG